jgi:methionyl-tRNA synthetase
MKAKNFYISTALPYVNAEPHIGHACEFVRADIIARSKKLQGFDVFFNTGTDEHGQKVYKAAQESGRNPQEYVDESSQNFKKLLLLLDISENVVFTRTTDRHHESGTQEFWRRVRDNGYIYKKNYKAKYCVGCEEAKTESELVDDRCPIHPYLEIEIIDEENYFFKLSEFGDKLLKLYDEGEHRIVPNSRMNEMRQFIKGGLNDFSISRLKNKMSWGVPVPDDDKHIMYVWFDALPNYLTALGWPENNEKFEKFWKNGITIQYCGKDNTRFQSVMWQAMLMAAKLPPTNIVVVNGFVTGADGAKMSKSLGNISSPSELVKSYGADALRYFIAREISTFEDSPFTLERFLEAYNANLANGLGNLVSRIMKMAEENLERGHSVSTSQWALDVHEGIGDDIEKAMEKFEIQKAINYIWEEIGRLDRLIQTKEPFKLIKTNPEKGREIISTLVEKLFNIANLLTPFMPETSKKIHSFIRLNKSPVAPLFPRIESRN